MITVSASAPPNTIVGVAAAATPADLQPVTCNWVLGPSAAGFFSMDGANLISIWPAPIAPGFYPIVLYAQDMASEFHDVACFTIQVQ